MRKAHYPTCPLVKLSVLKSGCPQCDRIEAVLGNAVAAVESLDGPLTKEGVISAIRGSA